MTNQNEALSALVDDALGTDEAQQLLERLHGAPDTAQREASQRLQRYALLGEMMRADATSPWMTRCVQRDVVAEVMQQIRVDALQPNAELPDPVMAVKVAPVSTWLGDWTSGWRAPAFSMALAASVAGVMLLVVQPESPVDSGRNVLTAQTKDGTKERAEEKVIKAAPAGLVARSAPALAETPAAPESLAALESAAEADVMPDTYLLQHLTHAAGGPMRNLSSNVRLASYERP
jgi:negative regulator of sigma E activity